MSLTLGAALAGAVARLEAAGIDGAGFDARLLVAAALGIERPALIAERPLTAAEQARLEAMVARRAGREPVSRILGRRGFWTLDLMLGPATLDPRPDSETLVEAVLADPVARDRRAALRLLDFGTGSGCLLLALLAELPNSTGIGVDRSLDALDIARANAAAAGLAGRAAFRQGDWGAGLTGGFDVIVSNPPYIPAAEIAALEPEVRCFDPLLALDGGVDGLDCYRALAPEIARLLAPAGIAAIEIGQGQAVAVAELLRSAGLAVGPIRRDLGGVERCVVARRPEKSRIEARVSGRLGH